MRDVGIESHRNPWNLMESPRKIRLFQQKHLSVYGTNYYHYEGELSSYVSIYIEDQIVNLKLTISTGSLYLRIFVNEHNLLTLLGTSTSPPRKPRRAR